MVSKLGATSKILGRYVPVGVISLEGLFDRFQLQFSPM